MATQEQTAVQSGMESTPAIPPVETPVAPVEEKITADKIDEVFKSGNNDEIEAMRKKLYSKPETPAAQSPKPAPVVSPETPAAPTETPVSDDKKFSVQFHGNEIRVDDEDGLLGYGNVGKLKRSKVHADETITRLRKENEETRSLVAQKAKELDDLRKEYEKLRATPPPTPAKPVEVTPPAAPVAKLERPVAPTIPDLPDDPTDWTPEQAKANRKYQLDHAEYTRKLTDYFEARSQQSALTEDQIAAIVDARTKDHISATEAKLSDLQKTTLDKERQLEEKKAEIAYWESYADFQRQHKEFTTSEPIQTLHTKVMSWMDKLADAYGAKRPIDPNDTAGTTAYEDLRAKLAAAYIAGNPDVLKKVEGVDPPPKGHDTYFKLAELVEDLTAAKNTYVAKGELGPNASLHSVYLHMNDANGTLDEALNELRQSERSKGAEAVSAAVKQHTQAAVTIPNTMVSSEINANQTTKEDLTWFYEKSQPYEFRRLTPQERERYTRIEKTLGFVKT